MVPCPCKAGVRVQPSAPRPDNEKVRTVGYLLVGWILFGFATSGLFAFGAGEPGGGLAGLVAAAALVWLIRSYRRGPGEGLVRELQEEADRLAARLPAEPLSSAAVVNAWSVHTGDAEATARLQEEYASARRAVGHVQRELQDVRASGVLRRRELLEAKLAQVRDYVHSLDVVARAEPELVDHAIAEHAEAAAAIDAARLTGADLEQLVAADDRLQGVRASLRRNEERPLDAIRLAREAERLADAARRRTSPAEADLLRERLDAAEDELAAAVSRHAQSALAEVRGLPALAREQLERAHDPAALAGARAIVERIESHLAALERAAATARPMLEAAEQAVDAALADRRPAAERAGELTVNARELLRDERPDWLEVSALAERALLLLGEAADAELDVPPSAERAREARDELWSWALTSRPGADEARAVAEQIDRLLEDASRLEREGDDAGATAVYGRVVSLAAPAVAVATQPLVRKR